MDIVGKYSFNDGEGYIKAHFPNLLREVAEIIGLVDANSARTKTSKEKTMPGKSLYSPRALNSSFKELFKSKNWHVNTRIQCDYKSEYYVEGYAPAKPGQGAFREMDFIKNRLGVEVQFGKYAFMVYNVCAKMTIFHKQGFIDAGIEIVPVKEFANEMSTGVSYFEQFVWDLEQRGVSDIDIPVLIMGIR